MNNSYLQMFIWNYCPTACRQLSYASKSFHFYLCIKFRRIKCLFINRRQDLDRKKKPNNITSTAMNNVLDIYRYLLASQQRMLALLILLFSIALE